MRVAVLGPTYPFRGATGHYVAPMVEHLRERHEVLFISYTRQYPDRLYPGTTQKDDSRFYQRTESVPAFSFLNPLSWRRSARMVAEFGADAVVLQWVYPQMAPQFRGFTHWVKKYSPRTRVIFVCHNVVQHEKRFMDTALTRAAFHGADALIVHDESSRQAAEALTKGAVVRRADLPTFEFFNRGDYDREKARRELGMDEGARVALYFGHVRPYKGLSHLVEALPAVVEAVDRFHLLIVGEFWESRRDYEECIEALGTRDRVTIVDRYVRNEEVGRYFSAADLVVLPYVTASASGILQIAYAFSKPVVTTRVGGLPEVVEEGRTGFLVPPGDPRALADAIAGFFACDDAAGFAAAIERYRERFSWDRLVDVLDEVAGAV
ncbi:MAG: glycosyltransferase [Actinomycetota bacterium]